MNTTKLVIQFAVILTIGITVLYFSRGIQKAKLAAKAEKQVEPIVKRVELNLDDGKIIENAVIEPKIKTNDKLSKTLKNQGLKTLSEEALKPYFKAQHLDLSGNQLTELPRIIMKMPYLEELTLDDNNFESIPYFLRHCKRLKAIYVNDNPLKSIGLNLWKMKQLKALQLENTDLKKLPVFPDRKNFTVVLSERDYSNKSKEKLRDYLARKYKYTLFELF